VFVTVECAEKFVFQPRMISTSAIAVQGAQAVIEGDGVDLVPVPVSLCPAVELPPAVAVGLVVIVECAGSNPDRRVPCVPCAPLLDDTVWL